MSLKQLSLKTSFGRLTVAGGSRAGEGTVIVLPQLRLALDAGRAHRALPAMSTLVLSHGHSDHMAGLANWAGQRALSSLGQGRLIVPRAIADDVEQLLEIHGRLEGGLSYDVTVEAVDDGDRIELRRDIELTFFATDHRVPTLGTEVILHKRQLLDELRGFDGPEIARRRKAGETIDRLISTSLLCYCADSGPGLLESRPEIFNSEVLMIECTFFNEADRDRALDYGHTHLDDLLGVIDRLRCRHLVLLHASRRHRLHEIDAFLDSKLAPSLDCSLHHLVVEWD